MQLHKKSRYVAALLCAAVSSSAARAIDYHLERITPVLNQPTYLQQAPGDASNFVYYSQRITSTFGGFDTVNTGGGLVRFDMTTRTSQTIFDLSFRKAYNDNGVQAFAFHPDYANPLAAGYGKVYVASNEYTGGEAVGTTGTNTNNRAINRVEEFMLLNPNGTFRSSTDIVNTRNLLLQYNNNNLNTHLVEWVGFDPTATGDGRNYLYISTGDGSHNLAYNGGTSPNGRPSQNPSDPKGKILRVDVAGADAYPADALKNFAIPASNPIPVFNAANPGAAITGFGEVWATGLRNGYRVTFDRVTGDFYYSDVGEASFEEINFIKAGTNDGTLPPIDFGWPQREATHSSALSNVPSGAPHTEVNPFTGAVSRNPIQEYVRTGGQASIGGIVYHGPIAELQGKYFFADAASARLFALDFDRNTDPALFTGKNGTLTELTQLWNALVVDPTDPTYLPNMSVVGMGGLDHIVGFSEDAEGNMYLIDFGYGANFGGLYAANAGEIFKVVPGAPVAAPATTVWAGGISNRWDANSAGNVNFHTDQTGGTNTLAPPGLNSHVVFSASGAANLSTALGRDFFIDHLTIAAGSPAVTIASQTGSPFTNTLVILGTGGITLEPGAGSLTISANIMLGSVQNWTNNSTAAFTVGPVNGAGGLIINGNVTLTGSNNYTRGTTVNSGSVMLSTATGLGGTLAGPIVINDGVVNFTSGTVSVGTGAGSSNRLVINGGTLITASELWLANSSDGYGYLEINGGTASLGSFLAIGRGNNSGSTNMRGVVNMNAGTLNILTNSLGIGSFNGVAADLDGVMTMNRGVMTVASTVQVGNFGGAVLTVDNDASITANGANGVTIGNAASVTGIMNLNGGNVIARIVRKGGDGTTVGVLNFNGGTLTAGASATVATFMTGLTRATIFADGAAIDDGGQALTIAQPLLAPTGSGVASIQISTNIMGYVGPPVVVITGGGGSGATAIANVDDAGMLQSISVTNPGMGYAAPPTVTLVSGGLITFNGVATAAIAPNAVGGGFTKLGAGSITLTGIATYGGPTAVNAGSLIFNTSSGVSSQIGTVSGAGNFVVSAGSVVTSNGVTLGGAWTINGTQHIRTGAGTAGTSKVTNLPTIANTVNGTNVTFTGTLNLADSIFIVQTTSAGDKTSKVSSLNARISSGANGALWNGTGITSSVAQGDPNVLGVGVFDNAVLGKTSYGGKDVDTSSLFVAVAHLGDTNRDGIVDIQDLGIIANNWQLSRTTWTAGDLNRDGFVDIQDLGILANNWQQSSTFFLAAEGLSNLSPPILDLAALNALTVPEVGSLVMLGAGGMVLLRRRRSSAR